MWWKSDPLEKEAPERQFPAREILVRLGAFMGPQAQVLRSAAGLLVLLLAADLAGPQLLRLVINAAVEERSSAHVLGLGALFVVAMGLSLGLNYWLTLSLSQAGVVVVTRLKERLFRHVLALPLGFFGDYSPGRLLARVESDAESLRQLFGPTALRLLHSLFLLLGILALMSFEDPRMTLAVLGCILVLAGLMVVFLGWVRKLYQEARRRFADISSFVAEYVQAVEVVQHYAYQPVVEAKLADLGHRRLRADASAQLLESSFWGLFHFFEILTVAVVIAVGSRKLLAGAMDVGTLVMFIEYLRQVFGPLLALSEFLSLIQRAVVSAGRVLALLSFEPEAPASETRDHRFGQVLRFEEVGFSYRPGVPVLERISFEIRKGQKVAVIGPSGGGKTTLSHLLLRFYDPTEGRITVDGVDLGAISRTAWRSQVGLVLQGVHLFPGSLRENLSVFDPRVGDPELRRALAMVEATELVARLPRGLDEPLAERGANLSLGERQLLSFARALVRDPPLLILDEATASVDPLTERRIQEGFDRMLAGRTAFIIAHRLSTIRGADLILVVQGGRIVEAGGHEQLYARAGAYRRLYDLQLQGQEAGASPQAPPEA